MTDTNPPQERASDNPDHDRLHAWVSACLTELLCVAEQARSEAGARRREALRREFGREPNDDFHETGRRPCNDDRGRRPYNEAAMERLHDEARLRLSLNRARAARSLHDLAHGVRR
jgi:hypothetical protein